MKVALAEDVVTRDTRRYAAMEVWRQCGRSDRLETFIETYLGYTFDMRKFCTPEGRYPLLHQAILRGPWESPSWKQLVCASGGEDMALRGYPRDFAILRRDPRQISYSHIATV